MKPHEAAALVGKPVKVRRRKHNAGFNTGRLDAVCGDKAAVLFKGHHRAEWVDVEDVRRWIKGESMQQAQRAGKR